MPKRMIDGEAIWSSDKLAACEIWARREYPWLYALADANGCFELTNLRVIWGKVAAIRPDLTLQRLQEVFEQFTRHGLLFTWSKNGKRYGHWTKSEGRLPPKSERVRHKSLTPDIPAGQLAKYLNSFVTNEVSNKDDPGRDYDLDLDSDLDLVLEKQGKTAAKAAVEFQLPEWVPPEAWNGYIEMRKKNRAPLTAHAMKLAVNELQKLLAKGNPPGEVLDQSTMNGWKGLFELKERSNGHGAYESTQERRSRTSAEAIKDVFGSHDGVARPLQRALPPTDK